MTSRYSSLAAAADGFVFSAIAWKVFSMSPRALATGTLYLATVFRHYMSDDGTWDLLSL
jgi:hypothetical protein